MVLHTWTKESAHNYENNCHEVSVFVSPGATYFEVEFDERCETEKRYTLALLFFGIGMKIDLFQSCGHC